MDYKNIHIGQIVESRITEMGIEMSRICNFMKCPEEEIEKMFEQKSLDTEILLKWSKLLEYDFFRLYSQHIILYSPPSMEKQDETKKKKTKLPLFRKNVYTKGVIDFILEQIHTGEMTKEDVIQQYRIPKTTLYKWIQKYKS